MNNPEEQNTMSTVDKLRKARELRRNQEEKIVENAKDYAKALNDMAASPSGAVVLKTLIKVCGVYDHKNGLDGVALIENNAKRNIYLEFIRPFLEPKLKQELEK